jgi:hypothetical protein
MSFERKVMTEFLLFSFEIIIFDLKSLIVIIVIRK